APELLQLCQFAADQEPGGLSARGFLAWMGQEKGWTFPWADNNPLNVSMSPIDWSLPWVVGATGCDSTRGNALIYRTPEDGVMGAVRLLRYGRQYAGVRDAFGRGDAAILEAIGHSGWSTSPTYAEDLLRVLTGLPGDVFANSPARETAPQAAPALVPHVVIAPGDTMWKLFGEGWTQVWNANAARLKAEGVIEPQQLRPGMVLYT
ncbi:MAG: hypothetical protein ACYCSN_14710, partial [Acidobacteriaceae bacterium]